MVFGVVKVFFVLLLCGYSLCAVCSSSDFQIVVNGSSPVLTITRSGELSACPVDGELEDICDTLDRLKIVTEFGCSYDCVVNASIGFPATLEQACFTDGEVACPGRTGDYFCDNRGQCCNLLQINETCDDNTNCCSQFCGQDVTKLDPVCVPSCKTLGSCADNSDCCYGYSCTGDSICQLTDAVNGGCFIAGAPMTLEDGTEILVEDIKVGDVLASPDGPADVIYILQELMTNTSVYGFNDETPFFTDAHVFPDFNEINSSSYFTTGSYLTGFIYPWVAKDFQRLANGVSLGRLDYTTRQVSQQPIFKYRSTKHNYNGIAYDIAAWPRNPTTRIPKLYMISNGWISNSVSHFDLLVAPLAIAQSKLKFTLSMFPPIQEGMSQQCYGLELGLVSGKNLAESYVTAFTELFPNETIPTAPPAGYDGPASEWIAIYKQIHTSSGSKVRSTIEESEFPAWSPIDRLRSIRRATYSSLLLDWFRIGINYEFTMRTLWMTWLPYSQGSQVLDRATEITNSLIPSLYPQFYTAITPCLFASKLT